jgi:hypothetical protein
MRSARALVCIGIVALAVPVSWTLGVNSLELGRSVPQPVLDGSRAQSRGAASMVGDLTDACSQLAQGGALALFLRMHFTNVEVDQGVIQTAGGEEGMFVEFQRSENHLLRMGVRTRNGFRRIFIARQTWQGTRDALIVLKANGAVSVTSGSTNLNSGGAALAPACHDWVVGTGNDLQAFLGDVDVVWNFAADPDAFDDVVSSYRDDLDASRSSSPWWVLFVALSAAVVLLVVIVSVGREVNGEPSRNTSDS